MNSNPVSRILTIAFLLMVFCSSSAEAEETDAEPIYLYGVEFTRPSFELKIAKETYEVIQKVISPRKLVVRNVTTAGLDEALKEKKADIVIANSGIYRRHLLNGWRDVVTLATALQPNPDQAVGSLILANKGSGIRTLADLKGHSIALNTPKAFQGTLTIKKELLDQGFDPDKFFSKAVYLGTDAQKRLDAVRQGEADSTFLSVCYAERFKSKTGIELFNEFQVVGGKSDPSTHCETSTDLYPNFSLLVSSKLSSQMIRQIAENLLKIKPNSQGEYWTFASDYAPVDKMYEALKEGPYQHLKSWTLKRIWNEFKTVILLLGLSILFAIWHIYATGKAVYKATEDILQATAEQKKRAEEVQSIKDALVVSSLSSVIAHELGQPLAASVFYSNSLMKLIKSGIEGRRETAFKAIEALQQQLNRATEILGIVQDYASKRKHKRESIFINETIQAAVSHFIHTYPAAKKMLQLDLCHEDIEVRASKLEFEIAAANLMKNSLQALESKENPHIFIKTRWLENREFEISIADNSGIFDEQAAARLEQPLNSNKKEGMGLGISIVKSILRRHGFGVKFLRSPENSLMCLITVFPEANDGGLNG